MLSKNVQLVKKGIALRAKYRYEQDSDGPCYKRLSPHLVVPHPRNRGGDAVRSMRTKQLTCFVAKEGCDPLEANNNAVAVMAPVPISSSDPSTPPKRSYQVLFEIQIKSDPDMVKKVDDISAVAGSLSHSNLNCSWRNMLGGARGCDCARPDGKCKCESSMVMDEDGRYCMKLVEEHDKPWAELIHAGLNWECIHPKIDEEEEDGAYVISLSLNRTNEAGMKTSHTEIMNTLTGLCRPSKDAIDGQVPFEPVREKMVEFFGAAVDQADFYQAFRFVMDEGGADSPHLLELKEFTQCCVNPKYRKMRFETYAVVAQYPQQFLKSKVACVKWVWFQSPTRGWCPLPPSIVFRFNQDNTAKGAMLDFMVEVEDALQYMTKCASMIMEPTATREKTLWIAEVDIGVIGKIFAAPKSEEGLKDRLRQECADLLLAAMLKLVKDDQSKVSSLPVIPQNNKLLKKVISMVGSPAQQQRIKEEMQPKNKNAKNSTIVETLVPTVMQLDAQGKAVVPEKNKKPVNNIEIISWEDWLEAQDNLYKNITLAKSVLTGSMIILNSQCTTYPVAIVRSEGKVMCKTTKKIEKGELCIPLFFQMQRSLSELTTEAAGKDERAVIAKVTWPVHEDERILGIEFENWQISIAVNPECKLPKQATDGTTLPLSEKDMVHPFWVMRRQKSQQDKWNCEFTSIDVTTVVLSRPKSEKVTTMKESQAENRTAVIPCITNAKPIEEDTELVLQCHRQEKGKQEKREKTWADDLAAQERKRTRAA